MCVLGPIWEVIWNVSRSIGTATTCPLGEWCVDSHGTHDEAADHPPEGQRKGS